MIKRYLVDLTRRERTELLSLLNKGIAPARTGLPPEKWSSLMYGFQAEWRTRE